MNARWPIALVLLVGSACTPPPPSARPLTILGHPQCERDVSALEGQLQHLQRQAGTGVNPTAVFQQLQDARSKIVRLRAKCSVDPAHAERLERCEDIADRFEQDIWGY